MTLEFQDCVVTTAEGGKPVAQSVLQQMLIQIAALINQAVAEPNEDFMVAWFGERNLGPRGRVNPGVVEGIQARTAELSEWLSANQPIQFINKNARGTMAFTNLDEAEPIISLGHGFPQCRWSWGERVGTLIHEFSHKALGTADVQLGTKNGLQGPEPIWSYGTACLTLAQHPQLYEQALNNAENWGYYICAYRNRVGLTEGPDDPSWRYLEKADFSKFERPVYLSDTQGHVIDPSFLEERSIRMIRVEVPVAVPPPPDPDPVVPCECGEEFPVAEAHVEHLAQCEATAQATDDSIRPRDGFCIHGEPVAMCRECR